MTKKKPTETTRAFKGLNKDFACAPNGVPFKFEVGKTYSVSGSIKACSNGFHACTNPFDVWGFYPVVDGDGNFTRYADVELSGKMDRSENDKIASAEITIKAEIMLPDFIRKCVSWLIDNTKGAEGDQAASGHSSQLAASGDYSKLAASGDSSVIASSSILAKAKGGNGTWISLAEYDSSNKCVGFATGCIGQDGLKPDVWYQAKGGKLIEV